MARAHDEGFSHVNLDGNIQALTRPDRLPIWVCEVTPGSTHDLTAAHEYVPAALRDAAARTAHPCRSQLRRRRDRPPCPG